jgi:hypothetical protein
MPQNSFNVTMEPEKDMPGESTCTSCQFSEDFSVSRSSIGSAQLDKANKFAELLDCCTVSMPKLQK